MTRRIRLIFNAHASRGRAWETASLLRAIVQAHPEAEWAPTEHPSHATELAAEAADRGFDIVAALGGDGTVHEVVNGLMRYPPETRPLLGIVPIGSGNDFSSSIGVVQEIEPAMERVFAGSPRWADLGLVVDGAGRREYFSNALGIGFDAHVTYHSYQITYLKGFSIYLWAVIQTIMRDHHPISMELSFDGRPAQENVIMLVLCNGPREGGGFLVAPEARPDDGALNYSLIRSISRLMMFRLIPEVMKGTHGRFRSVAIGTFNRLELKAQHRMTIHIDGEMFAGPTSDVRQLSVEVVPRAIQVLV
jgi:YegS/Rv2252/BmrU family lipid kinase